MKVELKVNDYKITNGKKNNNVLEFVDKNDNITFDIENLILKRENNEIETTIDFKNKKIIYITKKENLKFNIDINIQTISCENNKIIINYVVENETFNLILSY